MRVIAFDPLVSAERYRELGVEKAASADEVYARADFLTLHLPMTDETRGLIDAAAIAKMRDGVRILNVARGGLIDDAALQAGSTAARSPAPRSTSSRPSRSPTTRCSTATTTSS